MNTALSSFSNVIPPHSNKQWVVGSATCPICNRTGLAVVNDKGATSDEMFDYFENHASNDQSSELCKGSEKFLRDF